MGRDPCRSPPALLGVGRKLSNTKDAEALGMDWLAIVVAMGMVLGVTPGGTRAQEANPPTPTLTQPSHTAAPLERNGAAEADKPAASDEPLERAVAYLQQRQAGLSVPGLSAAIVQNNQLAWSGGWGRASLEHDVPATGRTVYRIGSISTGVTAIAVLQLVEQGKIALNTPIRAFVPEFPEQDGPITVRHLLCHQSGIRSYKRAAERTSRQAYDSLKATLEVFADDPLRAQPGQRFLPTPYGYNLLGLVVERLGEAPFGEVIARNVFEPAGMQASAVEDLAAIVPHRAGGYERTRAGELQRSYFVDLSLKPAAAGMISSAEDLARLAIVLQGGQLLSPEMLTVMTTPHRLEDGTETNYGLGWYVQQKQGRQVVGYLGMVQEASSVLLMVPESGTAVALLCNLERVDLTEDALHVLAEVGERE